MHYTVTNFMKAVSNKYTIYDVAKKAGLSVATVSRVINEPGKVNKEKRDKVLEVIKELNFVRKADAVANARQSYRKIGVIAPFFTEPSFSQRLRGIASVLGAQHYELVIYAIDSQDELDSYIDMLVSSQRVDGLIVLCLEMGEANREKIKNAEFPVCFVENDVTGFDCVIIENKEAGTKVAEYFYERGFRNPCFIGDAANQVYAIPSTLQRLEGFKEFFEKKNIAIKESNILYAEKHENMDLIQKFFKRSSKNLPDCIFASSDMLALKILQQASQNNIKIPESIELMGFDNIDIAQYMNLSTVEQRLDESGKIAAELVLEKIKNPALGCKKIHIEIELITRKTTGQK